MRDPEIRAATTRTGRPDLLVLANNHWNFDVRGFNPGGNHGSFFRISTHSTWMLLVENAPAFLVAWW